MPDTPFRVAVYYVPVRRDALWTACCAWLGRDPEASALCEQPAIAGIAEATSSPRRYGAHATLKPPMRLRGSYQSFVEDVQYLSANLSSFPMPQLEVIGLKNFLALCSAMPSTELNALAARCVVELDHHRLPEDEMTRAKRASGRSASELENLERWGYPFVLNDWKFHITLSNSGATNLLREATAFFAPAIAEPCKFANLAIFREDEPGADFRLAERMELRE